MLKYKWRGTCEEKAGTHIGLPIYQIFFGSVRRWSEKFSPCSGQKRNDRLCHRCVTNKFFWPPVRNGLSRTPLETKYEVIFTTSIAATKFCTVSDCAIES